MKRQIHDREHWNSHVSRMAALSRSAGLAVLLLGGCPTAPAQQAGTDDSVFKLVVDRNIFNPNRLSRKVLQRDSHEGPAADMFALVGTLSYEKGTYAFFDGSSPTNRRVVEVKGTIAGYTVLNITSDSVTMEGYGKRVELRVRNRMIHDEPGGWRLAADDEPLPEAGTNMAASVSPGPGPAGDSTGEMNDVLKKLMQRREQELK